MYKFLFNTILTLSILIPSISADMTIKNRVEMTIFGSEEIGVLVKEYLNDKNYGYQTQEVSKEIEEPFLPTEGAIISLPDKTISMVDYNMKSYDEIPLESFGQIKKLSKNEWPLEDIEQFQWTFTIEDNLLDNINNFDCIGVRVNVNGVNKIDNLQKINVVCEQWKTKDITIPSNLDSVMNFLVKYSESELNPILIIMEDMSNQYYPHFDSLSLQFKNLQGLLVKSKLIINITSPQNISQDRNRNIYDDAAEMIRFVGQQAGREPDDKIMTVFSLSSYLVDVNFDEVDNNVFEIPKDFKKIIE